MTRLAGELVVSATSQHTQQVITGFIMLQRSGVMDVALRHDTRYRSQLPTSHLVELRLRGGPRVAYDMIDGYNFSGPVRFPDYLAGVDVYFKRSFDAARHAQLTHASRIMPYGLNYPVTVRHRFFARLGSSGFRGWLGRAPRMIIGTRSLDVRRFEDVPRQRREPGILFQTRTWDPAENASNISPRYREEREQMNEMRASCVRLLRREFGDRFRGGFMPTEHARRQFPDCVVDPAEASKARFMLHLKRSDICVAATGLHGSNGWSLGEYVAASKGIVSQRLRYEVPEFEDGRHYLGFSTAEECVERVAELLVDPARLRRMKIENYAYYHRFLRPDRLILNSLLVALGAPASSVSPAAECELASLSR